jgi:hypothetical protein
MKRREFIKLSSLLAAGAAVTPGFLLGGCAAKPLPGHRRGDRHAHHMRYVLLEMRGHISTRKKASSGRSPATRMIFTAVAACAPAAPADPAPTSIRTG